MLWAMGKASAICSRCSRSDSSDRQLDLLERSCMRAAAGGRGSVLQAVQAIPAEPVQPLVRRPDAHACGMCGFLHPQAVADHAIDKKGSTVRRKTGMFMQVHPGFLERWSVRAAVLPEPPWMNDLPRDQARSPTVRAALLRRQLRTSEPPTTSVGLAISEASVRMRY